MWFVYKDKLNEFIPLSVERVKEIIALNNEDKRPDDLKAFIKTAPQEISPDYENVVGQDSLTRFDRPKKKRVNNQNRKKKKSRKNQQGQSKGAQNNPNGDK